MHYPLISSYFFKKLIKPKHTIHYPKAAKRKLIPFCLVVDTIHSFSSVHENTTFLFSWEPVKWTYQSPSSESDYKDINSSFPDATCIRSCTISCTAAETSFKSQLLPGWPARCQQCTARRQCHSWKQLSQKLSHAELLKCFPQSWKVSWDGHKQHISPSSHFWRGVTAAFCKS